MGETANAYNRKAAAWVQSQAWWPHGDIDPNEEVVIQPETEIYSGSEWTGDWTEESWTIVATTRDGQRHKLVLNGHKYQLSFASVVRGIVGIEPLAGQKSRRFDGEMSSDLELWLGDAFMSWLPSKRQLLVVGPDGAERAVSEGQFVTKDGRVLTDASTR